MVIVFNQNNTVYRKILNGNKKQKKIDTKYFQTVLNVIISSRTCMV